MNASPMQYMQPYQAVSTSPPVHSVNTPMLGAATPTVAGGATTPAVVADMRQSAGGTNYATSTFAVPLSLVDNHYKTGSSKFETVTNWDDAINKQLAIIPPTAYDYTAAAFTPGELVRIPDAESWNLEQIAAVGQALAGHPDLSMECKPKPAPANTGYDIPGIGGMTGTVTPHVAPQQYIYSDNVPWMPLPSPAQPSA